MSRAKTLAVTMRAEFLPASLAPVAVGALLGARQAGEMDWGLFGWTAAGVALLHVSANVANDYFDYRSGNDAINTDFIRPFTGGSRTAQAGLISPAGLLVLALICAALSLGPALYLAARVGPWVLALGAFGAASGWLYTAPPIRLAARGWGEAVVAVDFGVLPVVGAYLVQTGRWSWLPVWVSLPLAVLIVAVLFVNQFPDVNADEAVGKRNWVVRLGARRASMVYALLMWSWPLVLIGAVWAGGAPKTMLLALAGIPVGILAARAVFRNCDAPSAMAGVCAMTVALHAGVGALMCIGLMLS
jgi:1,4-dihydroxy-2-naphthoate octaprenyltransferase